MLDMVGVAPRRRAIAPGEATVPIAHDHGPAHRRGDDGGPPPDIERIRRAPGDHSADRCVAREAPHDLRMDRPDVLELTSVSGPAFECPKVDDHRDVRPLAGGCWPA